MNEFCGSVPEGAETEPYHCVHENDVCCWCGDAFLSPIPPGPHGPFAPRASAPEGTPTYSPSARCPSCDVLLLAYAEGRKCPGCGRVQ